MYMHGSQSTMLAIFLNFLHFYLEAGSLTQPEVYKYAKLAVF